MQDVFTNFKLRRRAGRWAREIVTFYKLQEALINFSKPEKEPIGFSLFFGVSDCILFNLANSNEEAGISQSESKVSWWQKLKET